MQANQVAMDLSHATGLDLASATKQVELAMEGNGAELQAIRHRLHLKDGLSPLRHWSKIATETRGYCPGYVNTPWGQTRRGDGQNRHA